MTSRLNRRQFVGRTAALAGLAAAGPLSPAFAMTAAAFACRACSLRACRSLGTDVWDGLYCALDLGRDANPPAAGCGPSGRAGPVG